MPRNVRNFWIEVEPTDRARAKGIATGPVTKEGGINITLYQRDKGKVREVGTILGRVKDDGTLSLIFWPNGRGHGQAAEGIGTVLAETMR